MKRLRDVLLEFELRELIGLDLLLGVVGAAAGAWAAASDRAALDAAAGLMAGLAGAVIGAVVASTALAAAFLNRDFLRSLGEVDESPLRLLAPFFFTGVLGVGSGLSLGVWMLLPTGAPVVLITVVAALAVGLWAWAMGSLVRDLDMLVQFIQLQEVAAKVPDANVTPIAQRPPDTSHKP